MIDFQNITNIKNFNFPAYFGYIFFVFRKNNYFHRRKQWFTPIKNYPKNVFDKEK